MLFKSREWKYNDVIGYQVTEWLQWEIGDHTQKGSKSPHFTGQLRQIDDED